jgi:hypothetical protein
MSALSDLFGRNGVLEQLVLWGVINQAISTSLEPGLSLVSQDVNKAHPVQPLDPATAADLAARGIITVDAGTGEAARSGLSAARFADLLALHTVRLSPGDLATAVLRSYLTESQAQSIARPQGVDPAMLSVLVNLAGDAPGPQQLAEALNRGLVPRAGKGPDQVSFEQGIAESRLHDKWAPVIARLSEQLLTPADAAAAVVRNFLARESGTKIAAQNGVPAATFDTLVQLSGDAPGPQQLAEALRRGLIPADGTGPGTTSFAQGIAEGRLADKWAPVIKGLSQLWPTPADALDAALKGQISASEGKRLYQMLGGDLQFYPWLLAAIGDSPTPLEAAELAARGIIAWSGTGPAVLSYDQAVLESRYRNKWGPAYRALAEHIPPPSTIVSMLAHRNIDENAAHTLLLQNDMSPDVAAAYVAEAEYEAISDYRGLTQSAVIDMYVAHTLSRDQAVQLLQVLHVSQQAAGLLLDYADMRYAIDSINRSVDRIATLFTARKISVQTATATLSQLGITPAAVQDIIADLELSAAANVKTLTQAEITDAFYYNIMTQDDAMAELEALGYTPYDSWTLLSVKVKAPLPNPPPRIVAAPQGAVIPGVT